MERRMDQILREPVVLTRYDDADCSLGSHANECDDEHSRRRLDVVRHAVERRRHDEHDLVRHHQRPPEARAQVGRGGTGPVSVGNDWNYAQLLFVALIDALCQVNEPCDLTRRKRLFQRIAKTLVQTGISSPICFSYQLHGLREHVRLAFMQIMHSAQKAVHFEDTYARNHFGASVGTLSPSSRISRRYLTDAAAPIAVLPNSMVRDRSNGSAVVVSRYKVDFEELEQLGKGGFGAVFKVRHYLDSQFYAIKKIALNLCKLEACFQAMREVKSLAAVNHPNVVRYYASWLEFDAPSENPMPRRRTNSSKPQIKVQELSCESITNGYLAPFKLRRCLSSPDIVSGMSSHVAVVDESDYEASLPATMEGDSEDDEMYDGTAFNERFAMAGTLTLYLQMELCTSNLRTWLNQRNAALLSSMGGREFDRFGWVDKEPNKKILRQVLDALAYIHSQGIIHRDLKPSNVFLRSGSDRQSPRVLLGDFGLSCYEKENAESRLNPGSGHDKSVDDGARGDVAMNSGGYRHSTGMGTLAYSAPEQLKSQFYDCKADMFSFGIVAFEMYFPFTTYMERMHNIMRAREGELDETFQRRLPLEAAVIRQLVQKKASVRPSARQLLEEVVFVDDSQNVSALKRKLKEVEEELSRLRQISAIR